MTGRPGCWGTGRAMADRYPQRASLLTNVNSRLFEVTPLTSIDPRIRVCGVCATVLDYIEAVGPDGGPGFRHNTGAELAGATDHPPVPVEPGQVYAVTFCDLCYAPDPGFVLPADDFVYPGGTDGSAGCAGLVNTSRWNEILRRMAAGFYARHGETLSPPELAYLGKVHRLLRRHVTGGPRPGRLPTPADGGTR